MISNARNLIWANLEQTLVDCTVDHEKFGEIPFTVSLSDTEEYSRVLFTDILSGVYGPIAEYAPPPEPEQNTATESSGEIPIEIL